MTVPATAVYFDNNATTAIDPKLARSMYELYLEGLANPASQHRPGRAALHRLEQAKTLLAESLGAPTAGMSAAQVIVTSGGTEANNLVINGYARQRPGLVIVAASEHPSLLDPALALGPERYRLLPVDSHGRCNLELLDKWLRTEALHICLVSVMLGNNETGVLQDVAAICRACQPYGIPVHSDTVQAIGKIPFDMSAIGLSALSLTAHKLHGPVGVGAVVLQHGQHIAPLLLGGGQQLGLRPGTEPVVPAVAMAQSVQLGCQAVAHGLTLSLANLRDHFEAQLLELGNVAIVGSAAPRLPHVANVAFLGLDRQAVHMALDLAGVACSTGSACASGSGRPSPVLTAMGASPAILNSSLRFSFSRFTTPEEVDRGLEIITRVVRKLRG